MKVNVCKGPPQRGRTRWCFENVTLTGKTFEYPNVLLQIGGNLIQPIHEMTMSTGVSTAEDIEIVPRKTDLLLTKHGKYFFFIYNTDNYFHFVYDSLPILIDYLRLRETPEFEGMKLLMNPRQKYPFIYDSLNLLGILPEHIEYASYGFQYECVVVVNSYTHDGQSNDPPHSDIWEIYAKMKSAAFQTPIETPKKFYVSRRSWIHGDMSNIGTNYTTRRRLMVEDKLVEKLAEKGYVEVFCENLSMAEKIQYFANATHVVGAIGGGMCNLVFASPSCTVVSLNSPEFATLNARFLYTMKHTTLTQFTETYTTSSLYRRVRIGECLGEVVDIQNGNLQLNLGNGVTWNHAAEPHLVWVKESDVEYLDNGLNSPWYFEVNKCIETIQ